VGPPLPTFDLERETLREYYENHYGKGVGFDYAYTFHAMAKAIQAAGRVIRSESDRGLIVLLDDRFTQKSYSQSFPTDWFDRSPGELVSKGILKEIEAFWNP
jgi:DNA excision repair protein ERCC-2